MICYFTNPCLLVKISNPLEFARLLITRRHRITAAAMIARLYHPNLTKSWQRGPHSVLPPVLPQCFTPDVVRVAAQGGKYAINR